MKFKHLLAATLALTLFVSCDKEDPDNPEKNLYRITQVEFFGSSDDSYQKASFSYEGEQLIQVLAMERQEGTDWMESSRLDISYSGENVTATWYYNEGAGWMEESRSVYKLKEGKITEEAAEYYQDGSWQADWKWTYTYSGNDLMLWKSYYTDDMGNEVNDGEGSYSYLQGKLVEHISYYDYDGDEDMEEDQRELFVYDDERLASVTRYEFEDPNTWVEDQLYEYTYSGEQLYEIQESERDGNNWIPDYSQTFMYDEDGNLTELAYDSDEREQYTYEEGNGNAMLFWYYPEEMVYHFPTIKSARESARRSYVPYHQRIRMTR